ncbi:MAG: aldo/keto reductase [Sulfolobaceae archaeon]
MKDYKNFKFGKVSAMAFGTWRIGGGYWREDRSKDKEWVEVIRKGIELGITTIDTAEMYGNGHAEELVGEAIKGFPRDELFIVTKLWPSNASFEKAIKSAKNSSRRLGTYIDLYLLHFPPRNNLCEVINAFEKLLDEGVVRNIGLSNFDVRGIMKAMECLKKYEIVAVQNHYSLLHRGDEADVIPFTKSKGMLYMAYTPLENGVLAKNQFLADIGKKYGKTSTQTAINWYIKIDNVIPIVKASKIHHVEENAGGMGWRMSDEDWNKISEHFSKKYYIKEKIISLIKTLRP